MLKLGAQEQGGGSLAWRGSWLWSPGGVAQDSVSLLMVSQDSRGEYLLLLLGVPWRGQYILWLLCYGRTLVFFPLVQWDTSEQF